MPLISRIGVDLRLFLAKHGWPPPALDEAGYEMGRNVCITIDVADILEQLLVNIREKVEALGPGQGGKPRRPTISQLRNQTRIFHPATPQR